MLLGSARMEHGGEIPVPSVSFCVGSGQWLPLPIAFVGNGCARGCLFFPFAGKYCGQIRELLTVIAWLTVLA